METLLQETQTKADQGDTTAMIHLSRWYYQGKEGLERSFEKSFEWALKGAEANDPIAQRLVAQKFEHGEGTAPDPQKAFNWYRKAYEGGDSDACYHLATYFEGGKGMEPHQPTALAYYEEGAKRGCGNSQYSLAFRLLTGKGVERNPARALDLLEESGQNGVPSAFEQLGRLYLQGRDVPKDPGMAFDCFSRALAYFEVDPAITVGDCAIYYALCLLTGTGCSKNEKLGREVLQVAANANNPIAREVLIERVVRNPQIQSCFGFDSNEAFRKRGSGDWDISQLLK